MAQFTVEIIHLPGLVLGGNQQYGVKYPAAVKCPPKDRADVLAFDDVAAEHRKHIRTPYPIECTFATARYRAIKATDASATRQRWPGRAS